MPDLGVFYEVHGADTPRVEDMAPLDRDAAERRTLLISNLAAAGSDEVVLDVGCGDGHLLEALTRSGAKGFGVELSASRVAQARQRFSDASGKVTVVEGSATDLPFDDRSFDVVTCSEVLEHLPEPALAVEEAWRVLRAGGRYIVTVPNKEHISVQRCVHCTKMTPNSGHLHSFNADSLRDLLQSQGFDVGMARGTYPMLNQKRLIGPLLRALPSGLWLRADGFAGSKLGKGHWLVASAFKR